ncbi:MAG: phenylalanine--tRNA ligase subunit beta [Desulfobacterales bacterium]|nr:phenylalanine--tRNA ligase subunit beta [Desulfobacterales bacterium]
MKVSLNWLKDYVDIEMSPDDLGHLLTMAGLEIEGIEPVGHDLDDIIVSKILSVDPHPGADRLSICNMDVGNERVKVVCGAPDLEEGDMVPLALPGARLPDGTKIEESNIRGENSTGVLLAEDEIGLTDDHTRIMVLSEDLVPGTSLASAVAFSDYVFDINITPNRPDCACILGVAREVAALTNKNLKRPDIEIQEIGPDIKDLTSVTIEASAACPRYAAGIIRDVTFVPSPFWMRWRLFLCGMRSINILVDVTNYVMMEMGQPLHAFDYDRLKENRIVVRQAKESEPFTTLDGQAHNLSSETLMICDGERAVAMAGIMGGLNSEIFAGTKHVLVESAFFDPVTIRRASKRLGISTEASYRFERGADIGGVTNALKRALSLISNLAGGKISTGLIDNYPDIYSPPLIDFRVDKSNALLGTTLTKKEISAYLASLEMEVTNINKNVLRVKPPSFRIDISREVDLTEEIARLSGYEKIPLSSPTIRPYEEGDIPELLLSDQIRSIMSSLGFSEIITYSFIKPDSAEILGAEDKSPLNSFVKLLNPITIDQSVLRTSLIPGVLDTIKNNIIRDEKDLRVFELGKVFIRDEKDELPLEKAFLAASISGSYHQKTWYNDEKRVDFYDIKGVVAALLKGLGLMGFTFKKEAGFPGYDPEFSAGIHLSGALIGQIGRISPNVMRAYDLNKEDAYLFELDIDAVLKNLAKTKKFKPFAKFPAVYRDISMIIERQMESSKITEIIKNKGQGLVESIQIFDIYEGKKIEPSKKAIGFKICYRSRHETLDGEKVNLLHESIIEQIRQDTGGLLREG